MQPSSNANPFPFLSPEDQLRLDEALKCLVSSIGTNPPPAHEDLVRQIGEIIDGVEGKLVQPRWKAFWGTHKAVAFGWFGDLSGDAIAAALHTAFTELVRYIVEGEKLKHRRVEWRKQVSAAVADYLVL